MASFDCLTKHTCTILQNSKSHRTLISMPSHVNKLVIKKWLSSFMYETLKKDF